MFESKERQPDQESTSGSPIKRHFVEVLARFKAAAISFGLGVIATVVSGLGFETAGQLSGHEAIPLEIGLTVTGIASVITAVRFINRFYRPNRNTTL